MPKQKPVLSEKLAIAKLDSKKSSDSSKSDRKTASYTRSKSVKAESEIAARPAKPVLIKLPRTLKKAARACAKAQGLKLRVWIVELIKIQLSKESTTVAAKSLQTQ